MKKGLIIYLLSLITACPVTAQFVNFGQDRPSLRWKQINTGHFQIIYPEFFETNAQKMANIYHQLYRHSNTLRLRPGKISVILHADGGISNGNVSLAPRKTELYTMPSQEPGDNWLEHLCVHEFRHVVQLDKVNQGLTKGLSCLFGDIFPIAVTGLYVPMWFLEGDAVSFETAVGHLGRGRSPEFLNEMKAQVVEKGIYNYTKAVLGSYKHFVPNRYIMGYFMTANSRINYGPDIWAKALERTGRRPFGITPFATSLKLTMRPKRDSLWNDSLFRSLFTDAERVKKANEYRDAKRTLYRDNFSELQQIWKKEAEKISNNFDTLPTQNRFYTNYYYLTPLDSGGYIAYKQGLQQTGAFVFSNGSSEKLITRTGIPDDYKFATDNRTIVWSEYFPHIRWEQGGRMRLSSYDMQTGKYRRYRGHTNQFSPFRVGKKWGYVEVDRQNRSALVLTDSALRQELRRIPAQPGELFIHPSYQDGYVYTVVQSPKGLHLEKIHLSTGVRQPLTEDVYYELDNPVAVDSTVIFRASYDGNNAFYSLSSQGITRKLQSRFGASFPAYDSLNHWLCFSFYTPDGFKPGKVNWTALTDHAFSYAAYPLADSMKQQEHWPFSLQTSEDTLFATRKYNKFTHLVNIHSWGPLYADLNGMDMDLGAVVYSQNKLGTLSFTAGYVRKSGYTHGAWLLNATYSGWWPVISLNLESGRDKYNTFGQGRNYRNDQTETLYLRNKAQRTSVDILTQFPLNISRKQYNRYLTPYFRYKTEILHRIGAQQAYTYRMEDSITWLTPVNPGNYHIFQPSRYYQLLEYGITFSNRTRMTDQEINPRWGQVLSVGYTQALRKGLNLSDQWWGDARFYVPGLRINHSLEIYGGFQHMAGQTRNYGNKIQYPRGITLPGYEIASVRTSYRFPIAFPDFDLCSLLYLKSLNGGLFYDFGSSRNKWNTRHYSSYGVELTADTHLLRLTYPIHLGIRTGYETQTKKIFTDLIFSIGLSI